MPPRTKKMTPPKTVADFIWRHRDGQNDVEDVRYSKGFLPPDELQKARAAARQRCLEIAAVNTPNGLTVHYEGPLSAKAFVQRREIYVPRPGTRRALHVYLRTIEVFVKGPECKDKGEWAKEVMRAAGLAIPRKSLGLERQVSYYNGIFTIVRE